MKFLYNSLIVIVVLSINLFTSGAETRYPKNLEPLMKKGDWNTVGPQIVNDINVLLSTIEKYPEFASHAVTLRNRMGNSAFFIAVAKGRELAVERLLNAGVNVNEQATIAPFEGVTALMIAVKNNFPTIVDLLLSHGANPYLKDSHGQDAFAYARASGRNALLERLNQHAAKR